MSLERIAPVLADLHLLTVLAQTGSFTQAASRLGISKASVSMRIAKLERDAGVPLVRRTTRSVKLTEAGLQLSSELVHSFNQISKSFTMIQDLVGEPRGKLRVTAPVALGRQMLAPLITRFLQAYPEVTIDLELSDALLNLEREGFDLAIRHTQSPPETYVAWKLCAAESWLLATPGYLEQRGTPRHPADLIQHQCLQYLRGERIGTWSFEPRRAPGEAENAHVQVLIRGPLSVNNSEILRSAALAGLGIAVLPDFSAKEEVERGTLLPILTDWRPLGGFGDGIFAMRPWSPSVPKSVRSLVSFLQAALAATPMPPMP